MRRFLGPLLDAAGPADEAVGARWPAPALLLGTARAADDDDPLRACVLQLYPGQVRRAERQVLSQFHFSEAVSYDLTSFVFISQRPSFRRSTVPLAPTIPVDHKEWLATRLYSPFNEIRDQLCLGSGQPGPRHPPRDARPVGSPQHTNGTAAGRRAGEASAR